jgi:hypothetical protein
MHPAVPSRPVFAVLLAALLWVACPANTGGDDDAPTPSPGPCPEAPCPDWPTDPDDYAYGPTSLVTELAYPEVLDGGVATCCRDFGAISRDAIEEGTDELDNAYVALMDAIDGLVGSSSEGLLNETIAQGDQLILLEQHGRLSEPFVLSQFNAAFDAATTWATAAAGAGGFLVFPESFRGGSGEPVHQLAPAVIEGGSLSAGPGGSMQILVSLGGPMLALPVRDLLVEATVAAGGSLQRGSVSGYIELDDYFAAMNSWVDASCGCMNVDGPLYLRDSDGQWSADCPQASSCDPTEDPVCSSLGGSFCSLLTFSITGVADLDLVAGRDGYEAISIGLEWTGVEAQVKGLFID